MDYIHSLFKGEELLDTNFVAPRIEAELKDGRYTILHIATHGQFATDVNQSFLLTFDDKLTMTQLEQLVGTVSLSPRSFGTPHLERLSDRHRGRPCCTWASRHCGEGGSSECPCHALVHQR